MKRCYKCGKNKDTAEFYQNKRRKDGLADQCIACQKVYLVDKKDLYKKTRTEYYQNNKDKVKKVKVRYKLKTKLSWVKFFPKQPSCSICKKPLEYYSGDKKTCVTFDHHRNGLKINKPSNWLRSHPPTPHNIKIWESCNFGILCHQCNKMIPTENRKDWIDSAYNYVHKNKI